MIALRPRRHPVNESSGFALVITLIMVVLVAIIVIAFLISASADRTTSRSYNYRFQAEIAAQNALEAAKKALIASPTAATSVTADDTFLVLRVDGNQTNANGTKDAYYFLAKAQAGGNQAIDYYPLFAGGTPQNLPTAINSSSYAVTPPTAPTAAFSSTPAQETFGSTTKLYPALFSFQQPAFTQWQEIRDPNDTATGTNHNLPYQRYTFWVEDLAGYVDAFVAGNIAGASSGNARPFDQSTAAKRYQTTPGEIAMFTLFNSVPTVDPGDTVAKNLISNRALLLTVPTLKQLAPGPGNTDITSPVLAGRLVSDKELPLVPFGYGYTDEGNLSKPKVDINAQVTAGGAAAVQAIATKINDNLPTFGSQRKGGLTGLDYINSVAASMIDYADTDSDATIGTDYRGYDSYPLVSEIYTAKNWTKKYQNPAVTGPWYVEITLEWWVELWNMSNQVVSGTVSFALTENHPVHVGTTQPYTFGTEPTHLHDNSTVATTYPGGAFPIAINMQPDEYKVLNVRTDTFQLNSGVSPPDSFPAPSPASQSLQLDLSTSQTRYEVTWKGSGAGAVVDKSNAGIVRVSGALSGPSAGKSNRNWRGSLPGFIGNNPNGSASYYNTIGDPRLAYYWACPQAPNSYTTDSSMWGRNIRYGITTAPPPIYKEVKPTSWPDRGHNSVTVTAAAGTATKDPAATSPVTTESTKAPATISNAGTYSTVAEFANIYDPGQWNITPDANNRWNDIINSTSADGNYGGAMTLRIGRPEFARFDQPKLQAWQLLDIFSAGNRIDTRGLVNINTASRDALRALGANVLLNRDPDLKDSGGTSIPALYPPYTANQADLFANAVIAARPFLSPAQLSSLKIAGTSTSFFGNSAAWSGTPQTQPDEWNDSSTEEYFAKVFSLASVRSRNFRVFVTGQALDKNGNVLSTVSKVLQLYLNPVRDPITGKVNSQTVTTTYEAQLPL